MTTAATRSLEIALSGVTPNSRISMGVMSAPPPAPVMPTSNPMTALPRTMYGSMCMPTPQVVYQVGAEYPHKYAVTELIKKGVAQPRTLLLSSRRSQFSLCLAPRDLRGQLFFVEEHSRRPS